MNSLKISFCILLSLTIQAPLLLSQKSERAKNEDVWDRAINEAAQETKNNEDSATPDAKNWCDELLRVHIGKLPGDYSHPQISSTELTPEERAAGVVCKISVNLQGPDPFNAIRFRVFSSVAAAERGLKSLPKFVPGIAVYESQPQLQGREKPCMVYTAGDRKLLFVSCADQVKGVPVVVSGVSSQRNEEGSYNTNLVFKAADLLEAAEDHVASIKSIQSENRVTQKEKTMIASQLEPWQTSVPEFVKEVQRLYSQGASEEELTKHFNGKEVHWQGRVIGKEKPVRVRLGDYSIKLQNGRVASLDDMVLFGPNFAPPANTVIRFRVTLMREDKDFPFPPVRVADRVNEQDRSTRVVVWVDAEHDAALE